MFSRGVIVESVTSNRQRHHHNEFAREEQLLVGRELADDLVCYLRSTLGTEYQSKPEALQAQSEPGTI